jgi:hypothetical protein
MDDFIDTLIDKDDINSLIGYSTAHNTTCMKFLFVLLQCFERFRCNLKTFRQI